MRRYSVIVGSVNISFGTTPLPWGGEVDLLQVLAERKFDDAGFTLFTPRGLVDVVSIVE